MRLGLGGGSAPDRVRRAYFTPESVGGGWEYLPCGAALLFRCDNQGGGNFPNLVCQGVQWLTEVTTIDDAGRFTGAEGAKGRAWHKEDMAQRGDGAD